MAKKCATCNKIISDTRYLSCSNCKNLHHVNCTNRSESLFSLMKQKGSHSWKCKTCTMKKQHNTKKSMINTSPVSNSNTPPSFVTQRTKVKVNVITAETSTKNLNRSQTQPTEAVEATPRKLKVNVETRNSFESLSTDDSDDEDLSINKQFNLNRSCPEIGITMEEDLDDLKIKITDLEAKLLIAENEIENLVMENSGLKKKITAYEKKTEQLTRICQSTPVRERFRKERKSINKNELDYSCSENTMDDLSSLPIMESNEDESLTNKTNTRNEETSDITMIPEEVRGNSNNITTLPPLKKVLLLCDQYGKGVRSSLQKLLGNDFQVTAVIKPNAQLNQILANCKEICKDFTKSDYIIIMAGSNDRTPLDFQSVLYYYLSLLQSTNVLITEICNNKALNTDKLNKQARLTCSRFPYARFVPLNYNDNLIQHRKLHTGRLILREILNIYYRNRSNNYVKTFKPQTLLKINVKAAPNEITQHKGNAKEKTYKQLTIPICFNNIKNNAKEPIINENNHENPLNVDGNNRLEFFR